MKALFWGTLMSLVCIGSITYAAPTQWEIADGGNGHYYELIELPPNGISWSDAKIASETATYLGVSGHLATITTQAENDFCSGVLFPLGTLNCYWIGGFQPPTAAEPDQGWEWVTGEVWDYTNWNPLNPEPTNSGKYGNEDEILIYNLSLSDAVFGSWNDAQGDDLSLWGAQTGYIVEYDTSVIPAPSAIILCSIGVSFVSSLFRRKEFKYLVKGK